ncbi:MAG: c-type cytochrome biogenesis protein CcmI [Hyphomicrobiales bacterium]|nr:MAG: c-type cytochrome biogenesis protein CcmI [Hyphomicrobiales bacterium]
MMFWLAVAAITAVVALWLARPFLARKRTVSMESDYAISVYRDQIDELARDRDRGLIGEDEYRAAEEEIERRTLKAARQLDTSPGVVRRMPAAAAAVVVVAGAASLGLYWTYGNPAMPDLPLVQRKMDLLAEAAKGGDLKSRVAYLAEKTKKDPKNFEDWWMLGQAYAMLQNYTESAEAYRHAVELSKEDPGVVVAYAEAITLANGNRVVPAARIAFTQVITKRPKDPRARYYLALAKAQTQDFEGALADWMALKRESAPEAPWMPLVRRDITNMARFLKVDLKTLLPDATAAELSKAGNFALGDEKAKVEERIAELKTNLGNEPKDYKSWIELATLQARIGENETASASLDTARDRYKAAPFIVAKLDEAARALGLDAVKPAASEPKGPTQQDIANAASMSEEEQGQMIDGMVEGLAARLEENPKDINGWIMLIRSYSILHDKERAEAALATARTHFEGDTTVLAQLEETASAIGIAQ